MINSIVWLIFFGMGWSGFMRGLNYLRFLAPGIFMITIFSHSVFSGISVIWDKELGFLKEVLVAPASRKESIAGRIIGDSIIAIVQGIVILTLSFLLVRMNVLGILPSIVFGFLLAIAFSSLGVCIALRTRSMEGFQMILSILILPLIFLSGAIFPIDAMPSWMKVLAYLNPMTYAVDGARVYLSGMRSLPILLDWVILSAVTALSLGLAMVSFERSTIE